MCNSKKVLEKFEFLVEELARVKHIRKYRTQSDHCLQFKPSKKHKILGKCEEMANF